MARRVTFHRSTFPDTIRKTLSESLCRGRLPARLLYESIGQASRWLRYATAWSPIHRKDEIHALYQSVYQSVLNGMEGEGFHYLALGCGDGQKDASFLELATSLKLRTSVTLVDVSPALTLDAAQRLNAWSSELKVADLASRPHVSELCEPVDGQPLVISCLGMLPTLGHDLLLPYLESLLNQNDRLILSANLSPTESDADKAAILSQYDNREARLWYSGMLLELGLERKDFALKCCVASQDGIAGAYHIVTHAEMLRSVDLHVYGDQYPMKAGDRLEVFRSERWTPSALRHRLSDLGLDISCNRESADGQEGVYAIMKRNQSFR